MTNQLHPSSHSTQTKKVRLALLSGSIEDEKIVMNVLNKIPRIEVFILRSLGDVIDFLQNLHPLHCLWVDDEGGWHAQRELVEKIRQTAPNIAVPLVVFHPPKLNHHWETANSFVVKRLELAAFEDAITTAANYWLKINTPPTLTVSVQRPNLLHSSQKTAL